MDVNGCVGVVGLGFLGRGIVGCLLGNGMRVRAYTIDRADFVEARRHISRAIEELIDRGGFDPKLRDEWASRYVEASSIGDLRGCDFVIESITEDLPAKRRVFDELEAPGVLADDATIASNTSALPISLLQEGRRVPSRFVGMHWAEPCHVMRFVEVIAGAQTSAVTIERTMSLARALGKDPVLVRKDVDGFIANRLLYAMLREAFSLLERGIADADAIDRAFRNSLGMWASIAGPFRWMDLTGIEGYARVMRALLPQLSSDTNVPRALQELVDSGAKGVANRRGFYSYDEAEARRWEKLLYDHAWAFQKISEDYFGSPAKSEK